VGKAEDGEGGKFVQRVPKTLHRDLIELAKREGVSLNQLVTSILATAIGRREAAKSPAEPKRRKDRP
jgi:predicted HicB family RNase H-like nuclease